MTRDDRVLDLKIYIGRKKDRTDILKVVADKAEWLGLGAMALGGVAGTGILMANQILYPEMPIPDANLLLAGYTTIGGAVTLAASKALGKFSWRKINKLSKLYNHLDTIDSDLTDYDRLKKIEEQGLEK